MAALRGRRRRLMVEPHPARIVRVALPEKTSAEGTKRGGLLDGFLGARPLFRICRPAVFARPRRSLACGSARPVFLAFPDQQGLRGDDCRARDRSERAWHPDFRRHQSRGRRGRSAGGGAIGRLPQGGAGSDGGRRPRYQPASLRAKPTGYRCNHPASDHARRFPQRVRETERNARRHPGAGGAGPRRHHAGLYLGRAGPADHARTLSLRLCRGIRARGNPDAGSLCPAQSVAARSRGIGNIELSGRPAASCRPARLRRTGGNFLRRQSNLADRRRCRARGAGDVGRAGAGGADRRRDRAICPDRTLDSAGRRRTDRNQQHHAAEAQSQRAGVFARGGQHRHRRGRDVCLDRSARPTCRSALVTISHRNW